MQTGIPDISAARIPDTCGVYSYLCLRKGARNVHLFVENANDLEAVCITNAVVDHVASERKLSVSRSEVFASPSDFSVAGELVKSMVELAQIVVALVSSPSALSESRDPSQIVLCGGRKLEDGH